MRASLWSGRPWWFVDALALSLCAANARTAWAENSLGAFGFSTFVAGLFISKIIGDWLLRKVIAQRDSLIKLAERAQAAAVESHRTMVLILPVLEQAAAIASDRSGVVSKERSN